MNECGTLISWICYDTCCELIVLLFNKVISGHVEEKSCMGFFFSPYIIELFTISSRLMGSCVTANFM
jgi:hypothetical protein